MNCKTLLMLANVIFVPALMASQMHEPSTKAYAIASHAQAMRAELAHMTMDEAMRSEIDNALLEVDSSFSKLGMALFSSRPHENANYYFFDALYAYNFLGTHETIFQQSPSLQASMARMRKLVDELEGLL